MSRLGDLEARCAEATEGPWACFDGWGPTADGVMAMARIGHRHKAGGVSADHGADLYAPLADAEFIASARTDLPDLAQAFRVVSEALRDGFPIGADVDDLVMTDYMDRRDAALIVADAWLGDSDD